MGLSQSLSARDVDCDGYRRHLSAPDVVCELFTVRRSFMIAAGLADACCSTETPAAERRQDVARGASPWDPGAQKHDCQPRQWRNVFAVREGLQNKAMPKAPDDGSEAISATMPVQFARYLSRVTNRQAACTV